MSSRVVKEEEPSDSEENAVETTRSPEKEMEKIVKKEVEETNGEDEQIIKREPVAETDNHTATTDSHENETEQEQQIMDETEQEQQILDETEQEQQIMDETDGSEVGKEEEDPLTFAKAPPKTCCVCDTPINNEEYYELMKLYHAEYVDNLLKIDSYRCQKRFRLARKNMRQLGVRESLWRGVFVCAAHQLSEFADPNLDALRGWTSEAHNRDAKQALQSYYEKNPQPTLEQRQQLRDKLNVKMAMVNAFFTSRNRFPHTNPRGVARPLPAVGGSQVGLPQPVSFSFPFPVLQNQYLYSSLNPVQSQPAPRNPEEFIDRYGHLPPPQAVNGGYMPFPIPLVHHPNQYQFYSPPQPQPLQSRSSQPQPTPPKNLQEILERFAPHPKNADCEKATEPVRVPEDSAQREGKEMEEEQKNPKMCSVCGVSRHRDTFITVSTKSEAEEMDKMFGVSMKSRVVDALLLAPSVYCCVDHLTALKGNKKSQP